VDPLEVIAVGDVSVDVFIRLVDDRVEVRDGPSHKLLVLPYGDKILFENAASLSLGGNATNAAVCFARLGQHVALVTHVGDDASGREVITALRGQGVDTRFVRVDAGSATNRNFVLLEGDDRTILVHHERYDYRWPHLRPQEEPRWVYLSSVGTAAFGYYEQLADWLDSAPGVRFAFQPGTLQIALGAGPLRRLYGRADVLVCNRDEAVSIAGGDHDDVAGLLEGLRELGAGTAVVTDGPAGAWASDGHLRLRVSCLPDESPPLDRTGAGDAFAATLVAGLAQGCELAEALAMAPVNARSVVHRLGSQTGLLDEKSLRVELDDAPRGWGVTCW
jgi:sugar/nucleoside kinase (ribokinase family)